MANVKAYCLASLFPKRIEENSLLLNVIVAPYSVTAQRIIIQRQKMRSVWLIGQYWFLVVGAYSAWSEEEEDRLAKEKCSDFK